MHRHAKRPSTGLVHKIALVSVVSTLCLLAALVDNTAEAGPGSATATSDGPVRGEVVAAPTLGAVAAVRPPAPEPPPLDVIEGVLDEGETLAGTLGSRGVPPETIDRIVREMAPRFDFRHARPGNRYRLTRDLSGRLVSFDYHTSRDSGYRLIRVGDGFEVEREEVDLVPRPALIAGIVTSSLYQAIVDLGEQGQLARDFADVFAWDIDFQRSVRPGDSFQIVYERLHRVEADGSETYVRPGRILAARYDGTAGRHTAIYFEAEPGRGGYYRPDGQSVEGEFLMSPLRHGRITSRYSHARFHPILKIVRPHLGIDYAAPLGTPVWSVADGTVIYRARAGSFGNLVKVRHNNGYVSYYAHLSRYAKDLHVGDHVAQKQVIGYVGATGLATGPHVCFRVQKDGHYVNPARLRTGIHSSVPQSEMAVFDASRDVLLAELDGGAPVATLARRSVARGTVQ